MTSNGSKAKAGTMQKLTNVLGKKLKNNLMQRGMKMQKIKARIPEGFKMLVEESFQGVNQDRIFVFEHIKTKKKLYAKLCSLEDIKQGLIWEVLTPEQLKELKIEESVNSEYYEGKTYVVEESGEDSNLWRPEEETLEEWKKRTGRKGNLTKEQLEELTAKTGVVNINIGSQGNEGKSKEELESENEDLKNKLSIIAARRFEEKKKQLNAPASIKTVEELMAWQAEKQADPTRRTSSGALSLEGQGNTGGVEFENQQEMIDFLQRRKASGTAEEKREAKAVLDELWRKMLKGKEKAGPEQKIDIEDEGTPLLTKFYEEWKKREKGED